MSLNNTSLEYQTTFCWNSMVIISINIKINKSTHYLVNCHYHNANPKPEK